jgi:hypothetical protein
MKAVQFRDYVYQQASEWVKLDNVSIDKLIAGASE